ncbi:uncharacterized protein LOC143152289 isoform X2 [Ptiloglossa arizonensis]
MRVELTDLYYPSYNRTRVLRIFIKMLLTSMELLPSTERILHTQISKKSNQTDGSNKKQCLKVTPTTIRFRFERQVWISMPIHRGGVNRVQVSHHVQGLIESDPSQKLFSITWNNELVKCTYNGQRERQPVVDHEPTPDSLNQSNRDMSKRVECIRSKHRSA